VPIGEPGVQYRLHLHKREPKRGRVEFNAADVNEKQSVL
jgi:hypothetical protein